MTWIRPYEYTVLLGVVIKIFILSIVDVYVNEKHVINRAGTIQGSFDSVRFRFKTVRFGFFRIGSVHVGENLLCKGKSNPCFNNSFIK